MAAILDGIKNAVTANATRAINSGLKTVAGNLLGGLVGRNSAPTALSKINNKTKFSTKVLNYPLDIDDPSGSGHYIIFRINVQSKGKLEINEAKTSVKKFEEDLKAELNIELKQKQEDYKKRGNTEIATLTQRKRTQIREDLLKEQGIVDFDKTKAKADSGTSGRKDSSSIQLQNPTTKRIDTAIALYMPQQISTSYQAKYSEDTIGIVAETVGGAILSGMSGSGFKGVMGVLGAGAEEGINQFLQKGAELAAPGAQAMMAIHQGKVITPKLELMFKGVGRRSFSYEFNFIPKSEKEAIEVEKIVKEFKFQMSADFDGGGAQGQRRMTIPSNFDIEYMYKGQGNKHLHKISTCVLEKMDVTYGGDKFVAYAGGRPQSTKISLSFSEMEIITKKRIEDNY
jgi:hypothetical protein|tara:strand:- start:2276 stop:3472 length:1197 start_codon:yes stop_codon:yes gene_type:complete